MVTYRLGAVGSVTLTASAGSYTLTGTAAGLGANQIPMSFSDPIFASVTNGTPGDTFSSGQSLTDKSYANENGGLPIIILEGNNTLTRCRFGLPTREGPRVAGNGTFTFNQCWIEIDGKTTDHADGIQAYDPGSSGTIFLSNTTVRAYRDGDNGTNVGSVGVFISDNWTGTLRCHNVIFWSGEFGCRAHPDTGGDVHLDFQNVYFVGPFNQDKFDFGPFAGHVIVVDNWTNVRDATIVGGVLTPGSPIASP
jgi:hypothetical protein